MDPVHIADAATTTVALASTLKGAYESGDWFTYAAANWPSLLAYVVTIASVIASLTKTRDSKWYKLIDFLALNKGKAKQHAGE